jgi:hypothetical protein
MLRRASFLRTALLAEVVVDIQELLGVALVEEAEQPLRRSIKSQRLLTLSLS